MSFAGIIRESIKNLTGTCRAVFLCILVECNHKDNPDFLFNNEPCPLKRGQWVTSIKRIEDLTGLSTKRVRTAVSKLEKLGKLRANQRANRATILTVVNIDFYLINQDEGANQRAAKGQTEGKPRAINNKDNNDNNDNNIIINARDEKIEVTEIQKRIDALGHPTDGKRMKDAEYELFDEIENKHDEVRLCEIAQLTHIIAYRILRDYKRLGNNPSLMVYGKFQDLIGAGARPNDLIEVINDFLDWQIEEGQHTTVNSWTYFDSKFNNLIPQQPKKHYLSNNVDAKNWKNKAIDIFKPKKIQDTKRLQKNRTLNELAV